MVVNGKTYYGSGITNVQALNAKSLGIKRVNLHCDLVGHISICTYMEAEVDRFANLYAALLDAKYHLTLGIRCRTALNRCCYSCQQVTIDGIMYTCSSVSNADKFELTQADLQAKINTTSQISVMVVNGKTYYGSGITNEIPSYPRYSLPHCP